MGRNSKARRDARKRKQARQEGSARRSGGSPSEAGEAFTVDPVAFADLRVVAHVRALGTRGSDEDARRRAASLSREVPVWALGQAVTELLDRVLAPALSGGWRPAELAEAVDRVIGEGSRAVLAGLILAARRADARGSAVRDDEIAGLGPPRQLALGDQADLALALRMASLFAALPRADVPVSGQASSTASAPTGSRASAKLAQVRALLAKAEATIYPDEAEALSAKAQELISKHSLEELLDQPDGSAVGGATTYRRIWLDAPYIDAKASLVDEVAAANRCRSVHAAQLGFCTVVGRPFDLDAVELMVTSLLAQAQRAMLAHGSRTDLVGRSRTRSFRQSFLLSFAMHIGQRLRGVADESVAAAPSLLPVLRDREAEVDELTAAMFPNLVEKTTSITNHEGWAGGRAAAELAQLNLLDEVRA
ncbi:DUF2786 domain-containing protein [Kribbella sp. NPDC050124]|uniref:DUF2786 domain-containing protein n=1 Tax=Kribbella sp. NPDC050124 TaxID=3364114 RepID=UPI00378E8F59